MTVGVITKKDEKIEKENWHGGKIKYDNKRTGTRPEEKKKTKSKTREGIKEEDHNKEKG